MMTPCEKLRHYIAIAADEQQTFVRVPMRLAVEIRALLAELAALKENQPPRWVKTTDVGDC